MFGRAVSRLETVRVLLVEDDPDIRVGVERAFVAAGLAVDIATGISEASAALVIYKYGVVVADRMVPDGDMIDFVRRLRTAGDTTPVLFLTAKDATQDRVEGFRSGGDDYLVKPFSVEELVERVRALGRRGDTLRTPIVTVGEFVIDTARAEVRRNDILIPLTAKERCILLALAHNAGLVLSRDQLIEHCWDEARDPNSNVVDVHIGGLRRKLGPPNPVETVRGAGFRLRPGLS
ncbi:MAG: response regulator transcription factor [Actinomycetota bacterium]